MNANYYMLEKMANEITSRRMQEAREYRLWQKAIQAAGKARKAGK